jgi:thymidylate synthase
MDYFLGLFSTSWAVPPQHDPPTQTTQAMTHGSDVSDIEEDPEELQCLYPHERIIYEGYVKHGKGRPLMSILGNMTRFTLHEELQYLYLIERILREGSTEHGRNGDVMSVFGNMMRFTLRDGVVPMMTTKRLAWKACFHELMWFLSGKTDNRALQEKGVHIWDANASREFLDSRGLYDRAEGDLGPIYGQQWRHWNAPYVDCHTDYTGRGIDQLQYVIDQLKNPETRSNRRLIVSAWNPEQLSEMALPPCHVLMQFYVRNGDQLSCALYQRSGDVGLGVPFNLASYSLLTHMVAHHCGLQADEFVYFLGNAHIYDGHREALTEQMLREPMPFPKIRFRRSPSRIEDYDLDDIEFVEPYRSHPSLKMAMVA